MRPRLHPLSVVIHQPNFLPRLKVLQKIAMAELWVILDDVQYVKREWQNRARLVPPDAHHDPFWLSLDVRRRPGATLQLKDVAIIDVERARRRIDRTLRHVYRRSPHWGWIAAYSERLIARLTESLTASAVASTEICFSLLDLPLTMTHSSEISAEGKSSARLLEICHRVGATEYISGSGSRSYLETQMFVDAGIQVSWQSWVPPAIAIADELRRDVCFLDHIAHCGPDQVRAFLQGDTPALRSRR